METFNNLVSSLQHRVSSSSISRTLILCTLLFLIENVLTKMMFITVQEGSTIEGIKPIYEEDNMESSLKCYIKCDQVRKKCSHVEVTKQQHGKWSCKIFKIFSGNIRSHLVPAASSSSSPSSAASSVVVSAPRAKRDCLDWRNAGYKKDDLYTIHFDGSPKKVFCDMTTDGGGWIVFQRRFDGSRYFDRDWESYKEGFGFRRGEHWLGNEFIHQYTNSHATTMLAEGKAFTGEIARVELVGATVGDEASKYILNYAECKSTSESIEDVCTDWNQNMLNTKFSTNDQDNDGKSSSDCAGVYKGGWWFKACFSVFFNAPYSDEPDVDNFKGICWKRFRSPAKSLKETKMMVRRS